MKNVEVQNQVEANNSTPTAEIQPQEQHLQENPGPGPEYHLGRLTGYFSRTGKPNLIDGWAIVHQFIVKMIAEAKGQAADGNPIDLRTALIDMRDSVQNANEYLYRLSACMYGMIGIAEGWASGKSRVPDRENPVILKGLSDLNLENTELVEGKLNNIDSRLKELIARFTV